MWFFMLITCVQQCKQLPHNKLLDLQNFISSYFVYCRAEVPRPQLLVMVFDCCSVSFFSYLLKIENVFFINLICYKPSFTCSYQLVLTTNKCLHKLSRHTYTHSAYYSKSSSSPPGAAAALYPRNPGSGFICILIFQLSFQNHLNLLFPKWVSVT